jgi:hypothetical protein
VEFLERLDSSAKAELVAIVVRAPKLHQIARIKEN